MDETYVLLTSKEREKISPFTILCNCNSINLILTPEEPYFLSFTNVICIF